MAKKTKDWLQVSALIRDIEDVCESRNTIFRGEPEEYEHPAASSIYRKYRKYKGEDIFTRDFNPIDLEEKFVEQARPTQLSAATPVAEILTDLRHFGVPTSLVDFTRDLLVALFFACDGAPEKDGNVLVLGTSRIKELQGDDPILGPKRGLDPALIAPARTQWSRARVEAQKSVFVHVPTGFVEQSELKRILVPQYLKNECLDYLERHHGIHSQAIFNDLIGFVQNEENFATGTVLSYRAQAMFRQAERLAERSDIEQAKEKMKHKEVIEHYVKSLSLRPDTPEALTNRGISKSAFGRSEEAISDWKQALVLARKQGNAALAQQIEVLLQCLGRPGAPEVPEK